MVDDGEPVEELACTQGHQRFEYGRVYGAIEQGCSPDSVGHEPRVDVFLRYVVRWGADNLGVHFPRVWDSTPTVHREAPCWTNALFHFPQTYYGQNENEDTRAQQKLLMGSPVDNTPRKTATPSDQTSLEHVWVVRRGL